MPQVIPLIAAAAPIASTVFKANSDADVAQKQADASQYGVDKNYDLGIKDLENKIALQRSQQGFDQSENALNRALQKMLQDMTGTQALNQISAKGNIDKSLQQSQQGFDQSENALNRAFEKMLKDMSGSQALDQISAKGNIDKTLQQMAGTQSLDQISARGDIEKALQKDKQGFEQNQLDFQNKAFMDAVNRANTQADEGEANFLNATSGQSPEMKAYIDSVRAGKEREQEQAQNRFRNDLTTSGVTGGQAATQLNRATGRMNSDLNQNLNKIALDEAQKRQEQRANFYSNKSNAGRAASYAKS